MFTTKRFLQANATNFAARPILSPISRSMIQSNRLLQKPQLLFKTQMRQISKMQQQETATTEVMAARREAHQLRHDIPRGKHRVPYKIKVGDNIHGFKVSAIEPVSDFDIKAYTLEHEATGAKWLHLDSSDMDNVFAVLFRTPPDDHMGTPHILEHLATCGSKHYPVRDPFFNMLKRSLNTYMNAWTGSDFTMYPFSTQNAQDFRNLMSVYSDMAFSPNLNYFDFRQEGHRLEFKEPENPNSGLTYKGVVYNEMKGAMSNPDDAFMHRLNENLFQKSQYKYNSGGEPRHITSLQYSELVDFHKKYYHPSNSQFFTYGDLDFTEHLKFVQEQVLSKTKRDPNIKSELILEDKRTDFIYKEEHFMPDMMTPAEQQAKFALDFLCNFIPSENPYEAFCLQILSALLLEGPNAAFYKSVIEAQVAPQFCPGAGFDHTTRQATFTLGVQGISIKDFKKVEDILFKTLEDVKQNGIDASLFETTLHQVEFGAKKTKQHTGLMYISHMVPYALHGGDPLNLFRINEFSARIREDFEKGGLFEGLIEKHLSGNKHYLKMLYSPDDKKAEREEKEDKMNLEALDAALTQAEKELIIKETAELKLYQEKPQDHNVLPSLSIDDISKQIEFTDSDVRMIGKVKLHFYDQPTNGISYVRIKANLKNLPAHLRQFVPMFTELFPDIGTKNYKYDVFNNKMLACTSGLSISIDKFSDAADHEDLIHRKEQLLVSTGFLDRNIDQAFECLQEILATPNFDAPNNISDLIKMESINKANSIGSNGLSYARSYSSSGLKAFARSFESLRNDIFFCQYSANMLNTTSPLPLLNDAIQTMTEIASHVFREENLEIAIHGNKDKFDLVQLKIELLLNSMKNENSRYKEQHSDLIMLPDGEFTGEQTLYKNFFKTPLQVNHCCESMTGPTSVNVEDYGALLVLTELMTYGFLLPSIREKGGAYGAGCGVSESGIISFYSYRDPQCEQTFENFERGITDVIDGKFTQQQMNESKLLAFQKLDKVLDPSVKGLVQFTRGYNDQHKLNLRLRALEVRKEDLIYVAEKYMMANIEKSRTSRVVFGSQNAEFSGLESAGWNIFNPIDFLSYKYFDQWKTEDK